MACRLVNGQVDMARRLVIGEAGMARRIVNAEADMSRRRGPPELYSPPHANDADTSHVSAQRMQQWQSNLGGTLAAAAPRCLAGARPVAPGWHGMTGLCCSIYYTAWRDYPLICGIFFISALVVR